MPRQETFFRENVNGVAIEVLKTYDRSYAREVFGRMSGEAEKTLAEGRIVRERDSAAWPLWHEAVASGPLAGFANHLLAMTPPSSPLSNYLGATARSKVTSIA